MSKKKPLVKKPLVKKAAQKLFYIHIIKPGIDKRLEHAGSFSTKKKAEAYLEAHPGWPYAAIVEG